MEKFYKISCILMGAVTLAALIVTLIVGATGTPPTASKIGLAVVIVCLSLMAILTVLAVTLMKSGGSLPHKIGFYLMHGGAIVLMVGFIITELATVTNSYAALNAQGEEVRAAGGWFEAEHAYGSVKVGDKELLGKDEAFLLRENVLTEYYADGMPKYYEATVAVINKNSGVTVREEKLTVNHPKYINGYKIYLMDKSAATPGDPSSDGRFALLLIKYNPGEYAVLIGIACLVAGTFLSCFTGFADRRKKQKTDEGKEKGGDRA